MSTTIKTKAAVWTYGGSFDLGDIPGDAPMDSLSLVRPGVNMGDCGYALVGDADVTIYLVGKDEFMANKVAALRSELEEKRKKAAAEFMRIEDEISKLLAVAYEAPTAAQSEWPEFMVKAGVAS